ncbi:TRAP transporter small permease [Thermodesulfobacteriota bacterium]
MGVFERIMKKVTGFNSVVAGTVLVVLMFIVVANIIVRLFGSAIQGTYELVEVSIIVVASLAISYTAWRKAHVHVDIVLNALKLKGKVICELLNMLQSIFVWAVIGWTSWLFMLKRGLREETHLLEINMLPFRLIWIYGLIVILAVFVVDLLYSFKGQLRETEKFSHGPSSDEEE